MSKNRSSISKAQSYEEIGEFWDKHDISIQWEETRPAEFKVEIQSEVIYYAVDKQLSAKIQEFARGRGVSLDTFLNLWMQEKLQEQNA